jgi:hypothetical protein
MLHPKSDITAKSLSVIELFRNGRTGALGETPKCCVCRVVRDRVAGLGAGAPAALGPRRHFLLHWPVVQHFLLILLLGGWVYLRRLDLSLQ